MRLPPLPSLHSSRLPLRFPPRSSKTPTGLRRRLPFCSAPPDLLGPTPPGFPIGTFLASEHERHMHVSVSKQEPTRRYERLPSRIRALLPLLIR